MPQMHVEVSYASLPESVARTIAESLAHATVLRVLPTGRTPTDIKSYWREVVGQLGEIDPPVDDGHSGIAANESWWDIRYDPSQSSVYRHSATAQPLHTDRAFRSRPATAALFLCERAATQGGATTFLDATALCETLEKENPDLLAQLRNRPVTFARGNIPGQTTTIISVRSGRPVVNWNRYRVAPNQAAEIYEMSDRFFEFLHARFETTGDLFRVNLAAGDVLIFKDQRLLHGREAFAADEHLPRTIHTLGFHLNPSLD